MAAKVTSDGGKAARAAALQQRGRTGATAARSPAVPPQQVPMRPAGPDADAAMDPGVFAFEPVRLTSVDDDPGPQVTLFYVDDTPYKVAARPRMDIGLEMIEIAATSPLGSAAADRYMLLAMLGKDGYKALRENVREPADYTKICAILARLTIGAVESPKDSQSA